MRVETLREEKLCPNFALLSDTCLYFVNSVKSGTQCGVSGLPRRVEPGGLIVSYAVLFFFRFCVAIIF